MENNDEKEKLVNFITKALAYAENGGKVDLENTRAGKTGEMKSIFQFTPDTWKQYSKEITGEDNVPLTNDYETYVVREKVRKWIDKGHTTSEIASMWNAGESKPNAYKENHKGINKKYNVSYDTPTYAKKVVDYAKQFYNNQDTNIDKSNTALSTEKRNLNDQPLDTLMNIISEANKSQPSQISDNALVPGATQ